MSTIESDKAARFVDTAGLFVVGFTVVPLLHTLTGWWLNSGTGVLQTVLVFVALGVCAALWRSGKPWVRACALWAGAISGTTAVLLWIGPGNIWPIVLATAAAITAAAVFGGAFAASLVTGFRR